MGVLQRIAAAFNPMVRNPGDERWWTGAGHSTEAGIAVTRDNVAGLDIVGAIREALASSVSTLPLMVYRSGPNDSRSAARDHRLFSLLHDRPNSEQTAQEFRYEMIWHLAFERNAYAIIRAEGDNPVAALMPVHPSRVHKVERDRQGYRWYTIKALGTGQDVVLRDDYVWHLRRGPLTEDGLRGRPIYDTDRETFAKALAVEAYGARWFRNSGMSGGVIKHPGQFKTKEDRQAFLNAWRESSTGASQHRDRLLTHGADYTPHSVQNDQAQFLETVRHAEIKICGLWNMPPHRVSRLDKATFSNIEQQAIEFVTHTLAPYITGFEQAAMRDLLMDDERARYTVEHNVDGLLRGDTAARYAAYATGRQNGWLSINDIRRKENLNPIPGGDEYLQPLNMQPVNNENADANRQPSGA